MLHTFYCFIYILIYFIYFFPIWDAETKRQLPIHTLMASYIAVVLTITIVPLPTQFNSFNTNVLSTVNIFPFRDIIYGYKFAKREVLFNILMMIPFGFFVALLTNKKLFTTLVATFLFSLTIETTQLFTIMWGTNNQRVVDITDIITNTIGGVLGYILWYIYRTK